MREMSKAYRHWVAEFQDEAWSLARYLLNDHAEAEDATQEAFTSLWRHRESIDPARVRPWLMKVLRNECFDRLRRRRSHALYDEARDGGEGGPMSDVLQGQLSLSLAGAIAELGEPYRSLVILRDIQQQSYAEVGVTLELSESQVKVYLHRARKQLREQLAEFRS
jgi:RNA polymerase sigma-70 factor (ECF subfamily)